ncbi:MAG: Na/Pi cotransporter family protein [Paracoccus sp. (in: a-proteobacteria)]|uniref:Na/Pi cotransporter family protein n=1 Tax=Paracoccus sp. TaxID=267 RepID=UPI0039E5018C
MASLLIFFQLAGAVALLLFGLSMVREGATDAFGMRLRMALGLGTRNGPRAFLSGLLATLGLQSSTATALLTTSFVEREMIRPRMAQVVLLGANLGTALTAWIVSSGVEAVAPLLIFAGYVLSRRTGALWTGTGRALIGIGLMLVSLALLAQATGPLRASPGLAAFLPVLDGAWPVALVFAAGLAVLCSSSLAAVLLVASLVLPPGLTVVLVLGANLGGAIPAVMATARLGAAARRVTWGNLTVRAVGCMLVLPFAAPLAAALQAVPLPETGLAVEAHLAFNLGLSVLAWPFAGLLDRLLTRLIPEDEDEGHEPGPQWLDETALGTPLLALTGASREVLAIGDAVQRMLTQTRLAFRDNEPEPLAEVAAIENRVDRRQHEVKSYLSRLGSAANDEDRRRSITILDYVINLEHMGDIIDKGLARAVRRKIGLRLRFSDAGYQELETLFMMTQENLRMAQTVFMTRDRDMARRLMELKVDIRNHERLSAERHLIRLREGRPDSRETSSLHLDILRDLKRINAHLVSVAHPILDEEGLLIESRLRSA